MNWRLDDMEGGWSGGWIKWTVDILRAEGRLE